MSDFCKYELTESCMAIEGQRFITYGIKCGELRVDDISTDKNKVLEMISRINIEQLDVCHLKYFIADELDR